MNPPLPRPLHRWWHGRSQRTPTASSLATSSPTSSPSSTGSLVLLPPRVEAAVDVLVAHYGLSDSRPYGYAYYGADSRTDLADVNRAAHARLVAAHRRAHPDEDPDRRAARFFAFVILQVRPVRFVLGSYETLGLRRVRQDDCLCADPPYLLGLAVYNERGAWSEVHERRLLAFLDRAHACGIPFGLSNVLVHKGRRHVLLED